MSGVKMLILSDMSLSAWANDSFAVIQNESRLRGKDSHVFFLQYAEGYFLESVKRVQSVLHSAKRYVSDILYNDCKIQILMCK